MTDATTAKINFCLNDEKVEVEIQPTMTLLELLRQKFLLTGAKEGCGKGECGACTVLLNGVPINSCLKLAVSLKPEDNVQTIEGLAQDSLFTSLQKAFVDAGAVQCGFCTPGMLISSYALLKRNPQPTDRQIKEAISGNLCRCTGYKKILAAVKQVEEAATGENS